MRQEIEAIVNLQPPGNIQHGGINMIEQDMAGAQDTIYLCNFRVSVDGEWLCLKELQDVEYVSMQESIQRSPSPPLTLSGINNYNHQHHYLHHHHNNCVVNQEFQHCANIQQQSELYDIFSPIQPTPNHNISSLCLYLLLAINLFISPPYKYIFLVFLFTIYFPQVFFFLFNSKIIQISI